MDAEEKRNATISYLSILLETSDLAINIVDGSNEKKLTDLRDSISNVLEFLNGKMVVNQ